MELVRTFEHQGQVLQVMASESDTPALSSHWETGLAAPGTGRFEIGPLTLSATEIVPGESLTLYAQIRGDNIAFIYTEVLLADKEVGHCYGPVAHEYVRCDKNTEVHGVLYPVWDSEINLALNITPSLRLLTDGVDAALAFMRPAGYGQTGYQLEGRLTRAGTESQHRVRVILDGSGEITHVLAYQERGGRSIPHAVRLGPGDRFSPFVQILTCPEAENPTGQVARGLSNALTWSAAAFRWVEVAPIAGEYLIGLVVEDLDGVQTRQYAAFSLNHQSFLDFE